MDFKSTPSDRNHAGSRPIKIYKGKPELKPVKMQISMRLLKSVCMILGLFVTGKPKKTCPEYWAKHK
jgi:hypothetical protein